MTIAKAKLMFHVPEKYRLTNSNSRMRTTSADGCNGVFIVPKHEAPRAELRCIASDGVPGSDEIPWEHVSITVQANRCPWWEEMCFVKDLFWDEEDMVMQYHPAKSEYVNNQIHCLHLWRPVGVLVPKPPKIAV